MDYFRKHVSITSSMERSQTDDLDAGERDFVPHDLPSEPTNTHYSPILSRSELNSHVYRHDLSSQSSSTSLLVVPHSHHTHHYNSTSPSPSTTSPSFPDLTATPGDSDSEDKKPVILAKSLPDLLMESPTTDDLDAKELTDSEEKAFLEEIENLLAKNDYLSRNLAHCVITGPTGSGKSSLLKRLLKKHLKKFSKSTGVAEAMVFVDVSAINPTTFYSATAVDSDLWKEVDYEVSLVSQISQISQSGTTTVPASTQPSTEAESELSASASQSADEMTPNPKQLEGKRLKFLQRFKRKRKTSPAPQPQQKAPISVLTLSFKNVHSVIKKHGFKTFKEYLKKTSSLYFRDTGGQVEFQEMLPLLIYGPSIFLFVFRADLDIQSKLSFEYRESEDRSLNSYTSSITTEEALLQFLASVYAMDTSGVSPIKTHKSLVFIVGTHIDQLGALAEQKITKLNQHIDSVIKENGFRDLVQYADEHKGSVIFPVDNTSESDDNFRAIRSKVNSLVSHREEFAIEYPTSFLIFCLELQNLKKAILSLDEFKALAEENGIVGEQVTSLLHFLHVRVGIVRYFDVDGLRDIVILEPQVLFNTITTLIVKTFSCEALPSREVLEFKEKGVLAESVFECVVSTVSKSRPLSEPAPDKGASRNLQANADEMKRGIVPVSAFETIHIDGDLSPKKFLQLLVQLRIIAPFPIAEGQEKKYFIPCVLNHVQESSREDQPHTDVLPIAVKFQCQHCPKGVFGVLVTHLMTLEPCEGKITFSLMQDKIFKDQVFFTLHQDANSGIHESISSAQDAISLKVHSSHLEINFFPESLEDRVSPIGTVCLTIRDVIAACIDKSLADLHYDKKKIQPFMCFRCAICSELHPVVKGGQFHKIYCSKALKSNRLPAQGRCWFNEECEVSDAMMQATGDVTKPKGLQTKDKDQHLEKASCTVAEATSGLTMVNLYAVTKHLNDLLNNELIELGLALGLYYPHLRKMNDPLHEMVAAWLNREDNVVSASGVPSWTSLIKALRDIRQPGIAQRIEEGEQSPLLS